MYNAFTALQAARGAICIAATFIFTLLCVDPAVAQITQATAVTWTDCAQENGLCAFDGTRQIRYGGNGSYAYQTKTNSVACSNGVFGDPVYGTVKSCAYASTSASITTPSPVVTTDSNSGWVSCASEWGVCKFSGDAQVRYGANGVFAYKNAVGSIACNNNTFGDPSPGTIKSCTYSSKASAAIPSAPIPPLAPAPSSAPITNILPIAGYPFANQKMYVDPYSQAAQYVNSGAGGYRVDAMKKVSTQPAALWLGNWNVNVYADVFGYATRARSDSSMPVFAIYNIPQRDCGSYSAGGASVASYPSWIEQISLAIGMTKASVILEPDALSQINQPSCLSDAQKVERYQLISGAIAILKKNAPNTAVYLDAGNSQWIPAATMAQNLRSAGVVAADGFSLNVSNFMTTSSSVSYGTQISGSLGGKHFVIDTGRNGLGPTTDNQWCNPSGRALGNVPVGFSSGLVDAYLWIKRPGESDGSCNGGPAAGVFWPQYAYDLATRS
jgi:endoglucanase